MIKGLSRLLSRMQQAVFVVLLCCVAVGVKAQTQPNELRSIDFRVNQAREAVIVIQLASSSTVVDVQKAQEGLSIELLNTQVADDKLYLLDVRDFSTLVEEIEVFRETPSTRLFASINADYDYEYQINGREIEVVISAPVIGEDEPKQSILDREGKLISINFQDIPVRNVLQLIADYNDFNLVVSDSVIGNLTLRLDGVPW